MINNQNVNTEKDNTPIIEWLTCKTLLRSHFTDQEILNALKTVGYTVNDLTDSEELENEPYQTPREMLKGPHYAEVKRFMTYKGKEWETTEKALVKTWRVTARYQGIKHGKIVQALLSQKFAWFNLFKWEIFECSYHEDTYEIYLKTEGGSLYVPFKALFNRDVEAIIKRMKDYYGEYYSEATINNGLNQHLKEQGRENLLNKALAPLEALQTKRFFALLKFQLENDLPTLEKGHTDNLKYADAGMRIWLSRMTKEDGEPYNNKVTVETLKDGKWESVLTYPLEA